MRFKVIPLPEYPNLWRLMAKKRLKKGGRLVWVCVAIGSGPKNAHELGRALRR